jgi:hypothetical protein
VTRISVKGGAVVIQDVDRELPILGPTVPILESALPNVNAAAHRSVHEESGATDERYICG